VILLVGSRWPNWQLLGAAGEGFGRLLSVSGNAAVIGSYKDCIDDYDRYVGSANVFPIHTCEVKLEHRVFLEVLLSLEVFLQLKHCITFKFLKKSPSQERHRQG
jgi:hypothetical protein